MCKGGLVVEEEENGGLGEVAVSGVVVMVVVGGFEKLEHGGGCLYACLCVVKVKMKMKKR